jgi:hypothetical protein
LAQLIDGLVHTSLEAWQITLRLSQHLYKDDDLFIFFMKCLKPLDHSLSKPFETFALQAS